MATIRKVHDAAVGDTLFDAKAGKVEPLPGFRPAKPMVSDGKCFIPYVPCLRTDFMHEILVCCIFQFSCCVLYLVAIALLRAELKFGADGDLLHH